MAAQSEVWRGDAGGGATVKGPVLLPFTTLRP